MAKKDEAEKLRERSRKAAEEGLKPREGLPVPPRKAMAQARKASRKLPYPLPPYPGANMLSLSRWAAAEWRDLGRWQGLAAPVVALVALLTWEKERAVQDAYLAELDKADTKRYAARLYGAYGTRPRRRKLLGFIPLPGRR
jgi:hypothetical protein